MESKIVAISHVERPYANPTKDPATGRTAVGVPVASVPQGHYIVSLKHFFDEWRHRPERREGTVILERDSFVDFVKRYQNKETTVMFVRKKILGKYDVTVIFNYHPAGPDEDKTGFADFRAVTKVDDYKPLAAELNMSPWVGEKI